MSWQHRDPDLARPEAGDVATRASDGERDAAGRVLNEAFAEGRLTADEHGGRVRAVFAARTRHELARLTEDLPGAAQAAGRAAGVSGGLDRCLLCALLICCPPAGIAWLLAAGLRARAARRNALTAIGPPSPGCGGAAVGAGVGQRAEDR